MEDRKRTKVIAGNWKMYKTIEETVGFIKDLILQVENSPNKIYLAVPFTAIRPASEAANESKVVIGAQNMNDAGEGAFTGEIAARMLIEAGARFVILGHSERRQVFKEDNGFINKKVKRAIQDGLQPILCVGEQLEEREGNRTNEVLQKQLEECLQGIPVEQLNQLLIAYEPVWAIGTGRTATPEIAEEAHKFIREVVSEKWGSGFAEGLAILYGGSVKPENAEELLKQEDIDGLLIGGASLSVDSFQKIANIQI